MSRRLQLSLIAVLLVLIPAACEQEAPTTPTVPVVPSEEASAPESQLFTVQVDAQVPDITSDMLAYFPREVSVHAGDTVEFQWVDTGEPHTVTFGSMADAAVESMADADPAGPLPAPWDALPVLIDDTFAVSQAAAQPCFLTEGEPGDDACPAAEQEQSAFDGNFTFYNSGWPEGAGTFTVEIDPETEPGTYHYLCLLHTPFMTGSIEVVDAETEVDSPEDVTARGEAEMAPHAADLTAAVENATPATAWDIFAGIMPMSPDAIAGANIFKLNDVTIAAGEAVTWTLMGPHNIAFNAPAEAAGMQTVADDGTVGLNMAALAPNGGSPGMPAPPPEAEAAAGTPEASSAAEATPEATVDMSAPPPPPMLVDGGEWNGEGYYNSGAFVSFPPNMFAFKLTFTEPGSYPYQCLIHPGMTGTITVQ